MKEDEIITAIDLSDHEAASECKYFGGAPKRAVNRWTWLVQGGFLFILSLIVSGCVLQSYESVPAPGGCGLTATATEGFCSCAQRRAF